MRWERLPEIRTEKELVLLVCAHLLNKTKQVRVGGWGYWWPFPHVWSNLWYGKYKEIKGRCLRLFPPLTQPQDKKIKGQDHLKASVKAVQNILQISETFVKLTLMCHQSLKFGSSF